jgi:hypothetical protein
MARLLETCGSEGMARLLTADFDGPIRDGAELKLRGSDRILRDGDMIIFKGFDEQISVGIDADAQGLHSFLQVRPWAHLRIGLEPLGDGAYAFRPETQHLEMFPELRSSGAGVTKW